MKIVCDELINYIVEQQKTQGGLSLLLSPNQFSLEQEPRSLWLVGVCTVLLVFFCGGRQWLEVGFWNWALTALFSVIPVLSVLCAYMRRGLFMWRGLRSEAIHLTGVSSLAKQGRRADQ